MLAWPISSDTVGDQNIESVWILVIVASILKTRCHQELSWLCQTVYWPGWAASPCNWMSIRPKQFWLIHRSSLSIFNRTDYIWQIVTFPWTPWLAAWACSWQGAMSWCLMFISYSVFFLPWYCMCESYLNIFLVDVLVSPPTVSGQDGIMIRFHNFNKCKVCPLFLISLNTPNTEEFSRNLWGSCHIE